MPFIPCCTTARKVGRVWRILVRESYRQMENQPKLCSPSLQPSVAISRSCLSCWGSDFGNSPYLNHLLLVYRMMRGLLKSCLAYNITYANWLTEEKAGLYVGCVNPQKRSRLIFKKTFYMAVVLPPTSSLVAIALISMAGKLPVQTGQVSGYFCPFIESQLWESHCRRSFCIADHLWLTKWRLFLFRNTRMQMYDTSKFCTAYLNVRHGRT